MSLAGSIWVGLVALAAVAAYLVLALPRLTLWKAVAVTGVASVLLLLLSVTLAARLLTLPMLVAVALLAGHAGWFLGHRAQSLKRTSRRLQRQVSRGRVGRREAAAAGQGDPPGLPKPPARPNGAKERPGERPAAGPAVNIDILPTPMPHHGVTQPIQALSPDLAAGANLPPGLPAAPAGQGLALEDLQRSSLGRYRIDRAIGRGSMGAVFLGLDPLLGRQVAIKTMALGREFAGAELQEAKKQFFREAETAGRLQHRDIVTIYDVGEEQDLAYIAMEFLKGHDLQRHTQPSHLLPVPVVLRLSVRVAEALAYAHSHGVVHRDIKPANVMLHLPTGAVKVTDFGIARITDSTRTRTGMVLGTPSFMSPEHLAGQTVDGRTDLYALGVMMFQLLTGHLPFQADSMGKLMFMIANEPAPDVRSLRPELPAALAQVIARLLEKNPAARHADGLQLAAELKAVDLGEGVLAAGAPLESELPPQAAAAQDTVKSFASTVRFVRDETGHNSSL
jgi:eukaryotic-like serine/threonine-protein kinase